MQNFIFFFYNSATLNEGHGHSKRYQAMVFRGVYKQTKFEGID